MTVATGSIVRHGALGLPLAFVALPCMQWANVAASTWALPLGMIGGLLLAVRALDAVVDPWLGRVMDPGCLRRSAPGWSPPSQRHWWWQALHFCSPARRRLFGAKLT